MYPHGGLPMIVTRREVPMQSANPQQEAMPV